MERHRMERKVVGMEWNGKNEGTKKWNELKWVKGTLKAG